MSTREPLVAESKVDRLAVRALWVLTTITIVLLALALCFAPAGWLALCGVFLGCLWAGYALGIAATHLL